MRGTGLTAQEREEISRGVAAGVSGRLIARGLGRHYSVVNREVARCGGRPGYRAGAAQTLAQVRARRPKPRRLEADRRLHDAVALGWRWRGPRARSGRDCARSIPTTSGCA